jgi:hypothetical protein
MNRHTAQPRKRGKKEALKQARKLQKTPQELWEAEQKEKELQNSRGPVSDRTPDRVEEAVDELWEKMSREENYPFFTRMEPSDLHKLVTWARNEIFIK